MRQSKAHQWIHVLLTVLQATLRALGEAPTRSVTELAKRLGVAEAEATALVVPTNAPSTPVASSASPLLATMAPNGASSVLQTRLNRKAIIAARKNAIR